MWRAGAGPCVAEVAEWGEHPDDLEYERILKSIPKKIMKRREVIVKNNALEKVKEKQGKIKFSVCVWTLSEFSRSSGPGDEAASMIQVFYESKHERQVFTAFRACGIDLESAEMVPVDPKSPLQHEQDIMFMPQCLFIRDVGSYEEGPPLSHEEINKKLGI
mmetsp:Transcript_87382/g.245313  ORF Transcript_87382/g.245313 Transcript_87382/m.245313 type:complete len:161 (-) Transcript_87382:164-646(-)|eukprot:CAMPEP_0117515502 /NCGR_PEP_ID=MMETSP0784-20121206/30614_1 /TAXON_ID=39447 /ORGANISM="" /LENGTH=160 /DNA_ID=CAMNT_0005311323 /DNA_START=75 /DNA_END=557 /DNA_ORIENTATION=-